MRATRLVLVLLKARDSPAVDDPLGGRGALLGLAERHQDSSVEGLWPARLVVGQFDRVDELAGPCEVAEVGRDQGAGQRPASHERTDEDVRAADRCDVLVDEGRRLAPVAEVIQAPQHHRRPVGMFVRAQRPTEIEHLSGDHERIRVGTRDISKTQCHVHRGERPLEGRLDRVEMRDEPAVDGSTLVVAARGVGELSRHAARKRDEIVEAQLPRTLECGVHRPGAIGHECRVRQAGAPRADSGGAPRRQQP